MALMSPIFMGSTRNISLDLARGFSLSGAGDSLKTPYLTGNLELLPLTAIMNMSLSPILLMPSPDIRNSLKSLSGRPSVSLLSSKRR